MEMLLAILLALGIFVGIPVVIGLTIAGAFVWKDQRVRRAGYAKAVEKAEPLHVEATKARRKAAIKEATKELVQTH